MTSDVEIRGMNFTRACEYLTLSPDEFVKLRDHGLIACLHANGKQSYPTDALAITQRLLKLGRERSWEYTTLAWYADLMFATEVGRAILLPMDGATKAT